MRYLHGDTRDTENQQCEDGVKGNGAGTFQAVGGSRLFRAGKRSKPHLFFEGPGVLNVRNCQAESYTLNVDSRHSELAST